MSGSVFGRDLASAARPIALGPGLLAHLDRSSRDTFIQRWRREFELQCAAPATTAAT